MLIQMPSPYRLRSGYTQCGAFRQDYKNKGFIYLLPRKSLMKSMKIHKAVKKLLGITKVLRQRYPNRKFTLDGLLVSDIGRTLVEQDYELELFGGQVKHYDAKTPDGRKVQIKTTMKDSLTFPCDHTPCLYLGIKVCSDGSYEEIFNGPGKAARKAIENRKPTKTIFIRFQSKNCRH